MPWKYRPTIKLKTRIESLYTIYREVFLPMTLHWPTKVLIRYESHLNKLPTWDISEGFSDTSVLVVDDAWSSALDAPAIPHFTLTSTHALRCIDLRIESLNNLNMPLSVLNSCIYHQQVTCPINPTESNKFSLYILHSHALLCAAVLLLWLYTQSMFLETCSRDSHKGCMYKKKMSLALFIQYEYQDHWIHFKLTWPL